MKLKSIFSAIVISIFFLQANAQQGSRKAKLHIDDIYIMGGLLSQGNNMVGVSRFKEMVPQSALLQINIPVTNREYYFSDLVETPALSVLAGFHLGESKRRNLRAGLSIFSMPYVSAEHSSAFSTPTDTFTSSQTGEKMYESVVTIRDYHMSNYSFNLGLDAAYIYNFFPESGISFFTGLGAGSNFSVYNRTGIYYSESKEHWVNYEKRHIISTPLEYEKYKESEGFKGRGNFGFNVYIPLGIDIQFGGNVAFLRKTHIVYEIRPSIKTQIGALGRFTDSYVHQNFGIKYTLI